MRRFAVYAAAAAITMTGTAGITAQAAVGTYVAGGNCSGGWSDGNQGYGNNGTLFFGNNCSVDQVLQMIISSGSGTNCSGGWGGNDMPELPGIWNNPMNPGCPEGWDDVLKPGCPPVDCPDLPGNPDNGDSGTQNPGTGNPGTGNPGTENPGTGNPDSDEAAIQQVIDLVNQERAKAGLSPVTESAEVSAAAAVRAQEITRSFSHTRPDGTYYNTVLNQNGVNYMGSGENIAYGQSTPAAVMNGWMNSQGHRENILNRNYTKIGVGCYENANGVKYWVQLFTY